MLRVRAANHDRKVKDGIAHSKRVGLRNRRCQEKAIFLRVLLSYASCLRQVWALHFAIWLRLA